jgi:hypothetical protein
MRVEGSSDVLVQEIRDLGLRFGIPTEYTSHLVQEPERLAGAPPVMPRAEAARQPTGAAAFVRARRSANFAEVKALDRADELVFQGIAASESGGGEPTAKLLGGRTFVLRDSAWTDIGNADRIPVTAVAAFSPAYFALVRMLPELAPYLSAGENVLVAGRRSSIRIAQRGIETWQPGELAALVRNFRGT